MSYGDLESNTGAVAEPKNVGLVDLQMPKEGRHVVRGRLERGGRIAIGRTAVPLLLRRDDPAAAGEDREHSAERDLNGGPAAMEQDERNAISATMHFVVHVDAIDRGMAALERLRLKG
jgi:hypothetical protein